MRDTLAPWRATTTYGRGIAAPQIGVLQRVVFMNLGEPWPLINPEIVRRSDETMVVWDACLSFLCIFFQVTRHVWVDVRWQDPGGDWHELRAEGDLSELLQHEIDHLDGVLALDRITDLKTMVVREEFEARHRSASPYAAERDSTAAAPTASALVSTPASRSEGGAMPDGPAIVLAALEASGAAYTIHDHEVSRSYAEGVERLPFPPELLLKTVVFKVAGDGWALATLHGGDRVDFRALADALGVRRADLRQASAEEIMETLGVEIGGVSPIPTIDGAALVFDQRCAAFDVIYCGTGLASQTLEISPADLLAITGASVASISLR